jgi:hypothetical protein
LVKTSDRKTYPPVIDKHCPRIRYFPLEKFAYRGYVELFNYFSIFQSLKPFHNSVCEAVVVNVNIVIIVSEIYYVDDPFFPFQVGITLAMYGEVVFNEYLERLLGLVEWIPS